MGRMKAATPDHALNLYKTLAQRAGHPQHNPSFVTHAAVFAIKCCSSPPQSPILIPHLHSHLLKTSLFSDVYVATALLHAYALSSLPNARLLFDEMPHRNVVTANTMITCLARHDDLSAARSLFNSMPERDIASWSAIIGGYMARSCRTQGLALFRDMMALGQVIPDQLILVTVLSGCASTGSFTLLGKSIHGYCVKHDLEINVQLGTSLIDMYMKCGCLMSAFKVFERMPERNVMHWTAMICGLALHGHGDDALAFFREMRLAGVRPNEITFTGVLNACCHAGLVKEGQKYFDSMVEEFGLEPGIHHYGCMVELFAKVGRLDDAYGVILSMKIEPNIVVWTSLLAACKKHGKFEVAEKVIDKVLVVVDPDEDGGIYTLISDLYAMVGRWSDAERVRMSMDKNSVKKNRGSSFI
ncbi:Tetratricopeptide-like helical domain-containing protein [Dioscorea alata]|uniref:Tetratricopeptide-like helical domain-containing protein n=1 Tax=Dioscorea alata TaxID=55571 RepID=A0ACB7UN78_DIOAL|nr:Tetratricopeptide-like helical domain-containing protein [Dioscorea alata]